jgi:disulfide bond formation protein DsbB
MSSLRLYPSLILLACVGALASALTAQYGFGLKPCVLCVYQRVPYVVAGLLAIVALLPGIGGRARVLLVSLCALAFAVDCGIAIFHVGVEQHWWAGLAACTGTVPQADSIEALQAMLKGPPPPRCDQIPWEMFGVSMAGYNAMLSLVLAGFAGWAALELKEQG